MSARKLAEEEQKTTPEEFTQKEVRTFLEDAPIEYQSIKMFLLLMLVGLNSTETKNLKWSNIDTTDTERIKVSFDRTSSGRRTTHCLFITNPSLKLHVLKYLSLWNDEDKAYNKSFIRQYSVKKGFGSQLHYRKFNEYAKSIAEFVGISDRKWYLYNVDSIRETALTLQHIYGCEILSCEDADYSFACTDNSLNLSGDLSELPTTAPTTPYTNEQPYFQEREYSEIPVPQPFKIPAIRYNYDVGTSASDPLLNSINLAPSFGNGKKCTYAPQITINYNYISPANHDQK